MATSSTGTVSMLQCRVCAILSINRVCFSKKITHGAVYRERKPFCSPTGFQPTLRIANINAVPRPHAQQMDTVDSTAVDSTTVDTRFALYDVASDEQSTAEQIAVKSQQGVLRDCQSKVTLMPTHHIDAQGHLNGFRLLAPAEAVVGNCPFTQRMFYGIAVCECKVTPAEIAALIADPQASHRKLEDL
eukprot:3532236-Rhodomonas_salina.1